MMPKVPNLRVLGWFWVPFFDTFWGYGETVRIELSLTRELNPEGLEGVRHELNFDAVLKTCPRTLLKVSQNRVFLSLGSNIGPKWCPKGAEIRQKSYTSGLQNALGILLAPRSSHGGVQQLKRCPKVMENRKCCHSCPEWFLRDSCLSCSFAFNFLATFLTLS